MICHFCTKECFVDDTIIRSPMVDLFQCHECGAYYNTTKSGTLIYIGWKTTLNKREYYCKAYCGETGNAPSFVVYCYTMRPNQLPYWEEVHRFDCVPKDWTPLTSARKLKTYLPFL